MVFEKTLLSIIFSIIIVILISSILILGNKFFKLNSDSFDYSVALTIVEYYEANGAFPNDTSEFISYIHGDTEKINPDFTKALNDFEFTGMSNEDFFKGDDIIKFNGSQEKQSRINAYIRKLTSSE